MKGISTVLLLLIFSPEAISQSAVDRVLGSAVTDREMQALEAAEQYIASHKFNSPLLREMEFRLRSNDSKLGLEDYRMRFGLINPMEIKANREYRNKLNSYSGFRRESKLNDILLSRYELLIEHYFLTSKSTQLQESIITYDTLQSLFGESSELERWLNAEKELTRLHLEVIQTEIRLQVVLQVLAARMPGSEPDWGSFELISAPQLVAITESLIGTSLPVAVQEEQMDVSLEETIMRIKRAESFSNIGFLQAEYDVERGLTNDDHLGYQVGVTVPIFNRDRPDLQRRELELKEDQWAAKTLAEEQPERDSAQLFSLRSKLARFTYLSDRMERFERLKSVTMGGLPDADIWENIEEYGAFLKEEAQELEAEILSQCVMILHSRGLLANPPYVNYLSADGHTFDLLDAEPSE